MGMAVLFNQKPVGGCRFAMSTLWKICQVLDCTPNDFLDGYQPPDDKLAPKPEKLAMPPLWYIQLFHEITPEGHEVIKDVSRHFLKK